MKRWMRWAGLSALSLFGLAGFGGTLALRAQCRGSSVVDFVCTGHMWCTPAGAAPALLQRLIQG